jgi:hypothetical protein
LHTLERRKADIAAGKTGKEIAGVSGKREAVLALPFEAYQKLREPLEKGSGKQPSSFARNRSIQNTTSLTARNWFRFR